VEAIDNKVELSENDARFFFREKRKCRIKSSFTLSQVVGRFSNELRVCPVAAIERLLQKARTI
jgi:hypothetical protein